MKRRQLINFVILLLACLVMVYMLTGCNAATAEKDEQDMFALVEKEASWIVVYHVDTRVMYVVSRGVYNYGTFTMLVNADGSPMIWEG